MTHFVYIACSSNLLDWAGRTHGRPAVKVGESRNPDNRRTWLAGRNPFTGGYAPPCAGYEDWDIVERVQVADEARALEIEAIFKTAFAPADVGRSGAGESDIVLLPEPPLSDRQIALLHPDIRDLYRAARSRMHRPEPLREDVYVTDEKQEIERETSVIDRDLDDDRIEGQDREERRDEDGWYYED